MAGGRKSTMNEFMSLDVLNLLKMGMFQLVIP